MITSHSARVIVENGVITTAVLDDRWDMKAQKLIGTETNEGDELIDH